VYRELIRSGGQTAASKAMVSGVNRLVAQEVVKCTVGGAVREGGRRGAVFAVQETAGLAAARGANVGLMGAKVATSLMDQQSPPWLENKWPGLLETS